jgi:hypothetical protein
MFEELGDTSDKVAQALQRLGIRGTRDTVRILNPIVRYAKAQRGGNLDMNVSTEKTLRIVFPDGQIQDIQLPDAVVDFLGAFNNGAYPQLESPF